MMPEVVRMFRPVVDTPSSKLWIVGRVSRPVLVRTSCGRAKRPVLQTETKYLLRRYRDDAIE